MIGRGFLRLLAALLVVDGVLLLVFGRKYVRRRAVGAEKSLDHLAMDWLSDLPSWARRIAGVMEVGLGIVSTSTFPVTGAPAVLTIMQKPEAVTPSG